MPGRRWDTLSTTRWASPRSQNQKKMRTLTMFVKKQPDRLCSVCGRVLTHHYVGEVIYCDALNRSARVMLGVPFRRQVKRVAT